MLRPLALVALATVIGFAIPALAAQRYVMGMPEVAQGSVSITGEYWALIIWIDKYKYALPLETAVKDATGVRDVLLTRYGFKRERIIELLDEQATRTGIEEALYKLGRQAGAEDSVFIYYAGHGQYRQDGRLGRWVPVEGRPQSPGTFITNASIRDYISGTTAPVIGTVQATTRTVLRAGPIVSCGVGPGVALHKSSCDRRTGSSTDLRGHRKITFTFGCRPHAWNLKHES